MNINTINTKQILLSFLFLVSMNTITAQKALAAKGDRVANGGSGDEVKTSIQKRMIRNDIQKIYDFYKNSDVAKKTFPEIVEKDFDNVMNKYTVKVDNEEKYDKHGLKRTCLNIPSEMAIECNSNALEKYESNKNVSLVLAMHEVLGLLGVEESSPEFEDDLESYEISSRLIKHIQLSTSYDLIESPEQKMNYTLGINLQGVLFTPKCDVKSMNLNIVNLTKTALKSMIEALETRGYIFTDYGKKKLLNKDQFSYVGYKNNNVSKGITLNIDDSFQVDTETKDVTHYSQMLRLGYEIATTEGNMLKSNFVQNSRGRNWYLGGEYTLEDKMDWALSQIPECKDHNSSF